MQQLVTMKLQLDIPHHIVKLMEIMVTFLHDFLFGIRPDHLFRNTPMVLLICTQDDAKAMFVHICSSSTIHIMHFN